ncbi:MAG: tetratricopeptide repeat protein [Spirochaetales bacterium]|nr:tetratricopeptide repeat protein [Spirochaetales bacterium]
MPKKGTLFFFLLILFIAGVVPVYSSSYLSQAEKLFLENKPQKALPLFEAALNEEPQNEKIYLYLGIVYEQLNDLDKSNKILRRGLNVATSLKGVLCFNIGNNLFKQQQFALAEDMYSKAIEINNKIPEAYLNRANSRIELKNYKGAVADYTVYLELKPENSQRAQIEKLLNILNVLIAAEEQKKKEELAKQKALMNDVLNSLKNASEDTKNLSAGSESIKENYEDVDIQD